MSDITTIQLDWKILQRKNNKFLILFYRENLERKDLKYKLKNFFRYSSNGYRIKFCTIFNLKKQKSLKIKFIIYI